MRDDDVSETKLPVEQAQRLLDAYLLSPPCQTPVGEAARLSCLTQAIMRLASATGIEWATSALFRRLVRAGNSPRVIAPSYFEDWMERQRRRALRERTTGTESGGKAA